jgi:hypothetical protein
MSGRAGPGNRGAPGDNCDAGDDVEDDVVTRDGTGGMTGWGGGYVTDITCMTDYDTASNRRP